jgi:type II secretory pathway component GspD/PulD (secretin)
MSIGRRTLIFGAITMTFAQPAMAQRGGQTRPPATKPDTTKKTQGVSLDFQDQELKVVLDALAAAGDLNVSMTNIPQQRVTVHMGRPVSREGMIELVKSVAESNGLKVTESPTLIQISGPTPEPPGRQAQQQQSFAQQLLQQQNQQQQMRLFTYRLKHASAIQLAPVLTNLFSGFGGVRTTGGTTIIPNANGGFTTINTGQPPGNINFGVPNNAAIPQPFNPNANPGRGGNAGRGGNVTSDVAAERAAVANQAAQNALVNRLAQVTQTVSGALSNQAGDIRIIAEESSNSLLVRATESDFQLVQQIIGTVDLRPLQVLIEVTIAEVQRTHDLDLGVSGTVKRIPNGKTAADVTATAPEETERSSTTSRLRRCKSAATCVCCRCR